MEVVSFNRIENDITARVTAPKRDQNGEICALIRIVTHVKDLMFEPDALGITARTNKPGEIWIYVPRGARRISIMHDQYGVLRNYFYPDVIDKATVYEMEVRVNDGTSQTPVDTSAPKIQADTNISQVPVDANRQLLVMRPKSLDVLGATFGEISTGLKKQLKLGYGVEVTGVTNGKMKNVGICKGFIILKVNGKQIRKVSDLEEVLKIAIESPYRVLFITGKFPSGKRANYAVDLIQE